MNKLKSLLHDIYTYLNSLLTLHQSGIEMVSTMPEYHVMGRKYSVHISSNLTLILTLDNKKAYFRNLTKHKLLREHIKSRINDYFAIVVDDVKGEKWKETIFEDINTQENWHRLLCISDVWNSNLKAMKTGTYTNYDEVGLPSLSDMSFDKQLCQFLKYIRGEIACYKNNFFAWGGVNNFNSNRQLATKKLSDLLEIGYLIPDVSYAKVFIGNTPYFGSLMTEAGNSEPSEIFNQIEQFQFPVGFFRALSNLEYLDALCYQLDHRKDNYAITINDCNEVVGVCAFDNDNPHTFSLKWSLPKCTYAGCSSVINKKVVNRPFVDKEFYEAIVNLHFSDLKNTLKPWLNYFQLIALWQRILVLRKGLRNALDRNPTFVVDFDDERTSIALSDDCLKIRINDVVCDMSDYGMTYLTYFFTVDEHEMYLKSLGE